MEDKLLDICGTTDRLALVLSGGSVRRYHQDGSVHPQSVSDHTWRALIILLHFWPEISRQVLLAMIYHDVAERYIGDIPATVKLNSPEISNTLNDMEVEFTQFLNLPMKRDLSPTDYHRLKCADYIELCITCRVQSGRRARQIYERGVDLVSKHLLNLPKEEHGPISEFMLLLKTDCWRS